MRQDPHLPLIFHRRHALAAGLTPDQITRRVATLQWHRLRRGVYCLEAVWRDASPERRAALLGMAAVLLRCSDVPVALSHETAAAMYDLPIPHGATTWLTVAAGFGAGTHDDRVVRQEVAALPSEHVRRLHGWPLTTPARTVADCLRHLTPEDAVAIADAALHRRLLSMDALVDAVRGQESWPLGAAARSALELVDGRRESPLESRSAVVMQRHGLTAPICQAEVRDRSGAFVARVDFAWPDAAVVGEADGRSKYKDDAVRAFEAEKDRQAELERLGLVVVRWGSRHLEGRPPAMVRRLREAMSRSPRSRFTGTLAPFVWPYTG
jgi:hypothetical protein